MTVHGEAESSARPGKSTFVYYARPFKSMFKLTRPDGTEITAGFDSADLAASQGRQHHSTARQARPAQSLFRDR
jgi:hypothetical protein